MALITLNRSPVFSVRPSVILPAPWPTGASLWPKALTLTNNGPTIASVNCARRLTSATTWHGAPSVWARRARQASGGGAGRALLATRRAPLDVCYHMARRAQRLGAQGTPSERGLLEALVKRYQSPEPQALTELARW